MKDTTWILIYIFPIFFFVSHTLSQFPQILFHTNTSGTLTKNNALMHYFYNLQKLKEILFTFFFYFYQLFILSLARNCLTLK